jgi:hypothetical protein
MDDPTRRCENDTDKWKRVTRGSCSQARAPLFCSLRLKVGQPFLAVYSQIKMGDRKLKIEPPQGLILRNKSFAESN